MTSSTQAGAQIGLQNLVLSSILPKINLIEKIKNLQSFSESKLNRTLGFARFFLPPNYDIFVVQYT